jgi:hypothetical protein
MTLAADCASVSRRWTPVAFPATMVCRGNAYGGCDENDSEEGGQKGTRAKTAKEMLRDTKRAGTPLKKKTSKTLKKIFG